MPPLQKLQWQCRRGTKELDLILQQYLQTGYAQAKDEEKALFTELLGLEDSQLSDYLFGEKSPDSLQLTVLISKIKNG